MQTQSQLCWPWQVPPDFFSLNWQYIELKVKHTRRSSQLPTKTNYLKCLTSQLPFNNWSEWGRIVVWFTCSWKLFGLMTWVGILMLLSWICSHWWLVEYVTLWIRSEMKAVLPELPKIGPGPQLTRFYHWCIWCGGLTVQPHCNRKHLRFCCSHLKVWWSRTLKHLWK